MRVARKSSHRRVPAAQVERKARFEAALKLAGLTAEEWGKTAGVTPSHLSHVLAGRRQSLTLTEKIDQFAAKQLATAA